LNFRPQNLPASVQRLFSLLHIDFEPPRPPSNAEVVVATGVAIVLSLVVDALIVVIATHLVPSTVGYVHFKFSDYAKLTVIGVIIACAGWPVVARITSRPRWLFFRLALATTMVLLLPDLYIWHGGQSIKAVAFLMCMHVGIAYVTYQSLVVLAPVSRRRRQMRS